MGLCDGGTIGALLGHRPDNATHGRSVRLRKHIHWHSQSVIARVRQWTDLQGGVQGVNLGGSSGLTVNTRSKKIPFLSISQRVGYD